MSPPCSPYTSKTQKSPHQALVPDQMAVELGNNRGLAVVERGRCVLLDGELIDGHDTLPGGGGSVAEHTIPGSTG